ncbi:MAG: alpha-galactosidase [Victivallales bacterium]|jgi:alpha-galactosidase
MNYSDIVQPSEMQDAKAWLSQMLALLRGSGTEKLQAEVKFTRQGYGRLSFNRSVEKGPLRLQEKVYQTGFGTHTDSTIEIRLPRPGKRIVGLAGVDDNAYTRVNSKALVFSVVSGGKEVWKSGSQTVDMAPANVDADLSGKREFTLQVAGYYNGGHADWADLKVILDDGSTLTLGTPAQQGECFSFTYGEKHSGEFLKTWKLEEKKPSVHGDFSAYSLSRTDKNTGLKAIIEIKEYLKFPVVEWMLRFKNTGSKATPVLEAIKSLDVMFANDAVLHYHTGDYCVQDGYEPHKADLSPGTNLTFAPDGGRPTDRAWPYYNLEYPKENKGVIVVVGWSGQWASQFLGGSDNIRIKAGQELTHFKLLPGEEVRTPLSVLMFWRGDRTHSHNVWRRWMMACNMPRPGGKLPGPMLPAYTGRWFAEMGTATTETQIAFMDRYIEEGIKLDYWWMDAGWYPCGGQWNKTGTWEPDPERFPKGLREIADYGRSKDIKTLVWFEPERVTDGTWLSKNHQEWLLEGTLLNLGNPDALKWLIEHISKVIVEQGIDLYRQDFNMSPLAYWRNADATDRQGITEIRHVEGYLAFWKELRRRFPDMLIDSCASGGRRNDLETMRLSVPLHKTDYDYADNSTKQAFHHSLALWLPYFGAYVLPVDTVDTYAFRSSIAPMTLLTYDLRRRDVDWSRLKKLTEEWKMVTDTEYFYGDYYPLTPYSRTGDQWIAWQFHRPDKGTGIIQAFRREKSPFESARFKLQGFDAAETYELIDMDRPEVSEKFKGSDLMESGLLIRIPKEQQTLLIMYRRAS